MPISDLENLLDNLETSGGSTRKSPAELGIVERTTPTVTTDPNKGILKSEFDAKTQEAQADFVKKGGLIRPDVEKTSVAKELGKSIKDSFVDRSTKATEGGFEETQEAAQKITKAATESKQAFEEGKLGKALFEGAKVPVNLAGGAIEGTFSFLGGLLEPEIEKLKSGISAGRQLAVEEIAKGQGFSDEEAKEMAERALKFQDERLVENTVGKIQNFAGAAFDELTTDLPEDTKQSLKESTLDTLTAIMNSVLASAGQQQITQLKGGFGPAVKGTVGATKSALTTTSKALTPVVSTVQKAATPVVKDVIRTGELAVAGFARNVRKRNMAKQFANVENAIETAKSAKLQIAKPKGKEILSTTDETRAMKAIEDFTDEISLGVEGTPQQQVDIASQNITNLVENNQAMTDALVSRPSAQQIPSDRPLQIMEEVLNQEKRSARPNSKRLKKIQEAVDEERAFIKNSAEVISPEEGRNIKRKIDESINFDGKRFDQLTDIEKLEQQKLKIQRDAYRQSIDEALPEPIEGKTFAQLDLETAGLLDLQKVFKEEFRRLGVKGERSFAENLLTFFEGRLGSFGGKAGAAVIGGTLGGLPGAAASTALVSFLESRAALANSLLGKLRKLSKAKDVIEKAPEGTKAGVTKTTEPKKGESKTFEKPKTPEDTLAREKAKQEEQALEVIELEKQGLSPKDLGDNFRITEKGPIKPGQKQAQVGFIKDIKNKISTFELGDSEAKDLAVMLRKFGLESISKKLDDYAKNIDDITRGLAKQISADVENELKSMAVDLSKRLKKIKGIDGMDLPTTIKTLESRKVKPKILKELKILDDSFDEFKASNPEFKDVTVDEFFDLAKNVETKKKK